MARDKKKAERPVDEASATDFSGLLGEDTPPPVVPAETKGRGAGKGVASLPPPTPMKPRLRKPPTVATEIVPLVSALPAPAPSAGGGEPADDFSLKAREAGTLLDAVVQQCREARTQLQQELEERKSANKEAE